MPEFKARMTSPTPAPNTRNVVAKSPAKSPAAPKAAKVQHQKTYQELMDATPAPQGQPQGINVNPDIAGRKSVSIIDITNANAEHSNMDLDQFEDFDLITPGQDSPQIISQNVNSQDSTQSGVSISEATVPPVEHGNQPSEQNLGQPGQASTMAGNQAMHRGGARDKTTQNIPNTNIPNTNMQNDANNVLLAENGIENWREIKNRTVVISTDASAGPYNKIDLINSLATFGLVGSDLESVGPIKNGLKWQLVFKRKIDAEAVAAANAVNVTTSKKSVHCASAFYSEISYKLRIHWVPHFVPDYIVTQALSAYGKVKTINKEYSSRPYKIATGSRVAEIVPNGHIDNVPDFVSFQFDREEIRMLVTAMGLKQRCHKCQERGHVVKQCLQLDPCRHCGSTEHTPIECAIKNSYARRVAPSKHASKRPEDPYVMPEEGQSGASNAGTDNVTNKVTNKSTSSNATMNTEFPTLKEVVEINKAAQKAPNKMDPPKNIPQKTPVKNVSNNKRSANGASGDEVNLITLTPKYLKKAKKMELNKIATKVIDGESSMEESDDPDDT